MRRSPRPRRWKRGRAQGTVDHVIIVGAGASLGARQGWAANLQPALGWELGSYLLTWLDANGPTTSVVKRCHGLSPENTEQPGSQIWDADDYPWLKSTLADCHDKSFEDALDSVLAKEQDPANTNALGNWRLLNQVIAQAMLMGVGCRFGYGDDGYDELLANLPLRRTAIISFNYDILLEEAIARKLGQHDISRAIHYPGPRLHRPAPPAGVRVYKPHGSINWFVNPSQHQWSGHDLAKKPTLRGLALVPQVGGNVGTDSHGDELPGGPRASYIMHLKGHSHNYPVLATCASYKPVAMNAVATNRARELTLRVLRQNPTAQVVILGLRPPRSGDRARDPFLHSLFAAIRRMRGSKQYVGPSDEDRQAALNWRIKLRERDLLSFARRGKS